MRLVYYRDDAISKFLQKRRYSLRKYTMSHAKNQTIFMTTFRSPGMTSWKEWLSGGRTNAASDTTRAGKLVSPALWHKFYWRYYLHWHILYISRFDVYYAYIHFNIILNFTFHIPYFFFFAFRPNSLALFFLNEIRKQK